MSLILEEDTESRDLSKDSTGESEVLRFTLYGTEDQNEAYQFVIFNTLVVWDRLVRSGLKGTYKGGFLWAFEVTYGTISLNRAIGETPTTPSAPGDDDKLDPTTQKFEISFDTSAETTHITQSKSTVESKRRGGGTPANYNGAIGVSKDGVAGCDKYTPKFDLTVTTERDSVTMRFIRTLRGLCATVNGAKWWGFDTGEVLYLGATGQYTLGGRWSLSHKFSVGRNQQNVSICAGLKLDNVGAWNHVWMTYEPSTDAGVAIMIPLDAYVEQIYDPGIFDGLEIGS